MAISTEYAEQRKNNFFTTEDKTSMEIYCSEINRWMKEKETGSLPMKESGMDLETIFVSTLCVILSKEAGEGDMEEWIIAFSNILHKNLEGFVSVVKIAKELKNKRFPDKKILTILETIEILKDIRTETRTNEEASHLTLFSKKHHLLKKTKKTGIHVDDIQKCEVLF